MLFQGIFEGDIRFWTQLNRLRAPEDPERDEHSNLPPSRHEREVSL
jgi:hypothetical protein